MEAKKRTFKTPFVRINAQKSRGEFIYLHNIIYEVTKFLELSWVRALVYIACKNSSKGQRNAKT